MLIGGAKSGKTGLALKMAEGLLNNGEKGLYIATGQARDREMAEKIRRHKKERGSRWDTLEEPVNVSETIGAIDASCSVVILDCMTLWVSNLLEKDVGGNNACEEHIDNRFNALKEAVTGCKANMFIVTNEVGLGIVPSHKVARLYRELLGRLNQIIASIVDEVYFVVAGMPLLVKGKGVNCLINC